jgi:hypothetical protein
MSQRVLSVEQMLLEPGKRIEARNPAATRMANNCWHMGRPNVSSSHRPLLLREHQVQVLNRSAGCAFAKIIEHRGQQDVPVFHVGKYAQAHVVRAVQHLWIQVFQGARFVQRQDMDVGSLGVVACEACV